ncbi:MAG: dipicolinate synthase subunit DpsA [Peptococcaceae bacterium]|nr:dipicolinate synthase subunit DpsA [Peptococcaceae bacterium]
MPVVLSGLRVAIVGGDRRVEFFLPSLIATGARVYGVGLDSLEAFPEVLRCDLERAVQECHVLILPMQGSDQQGLVQSAYSKKLIDLSQIKVGNRKLLVLSGIARSRLQEIASQSSWKLVEIADDNELAILNSIPTAEGAVRLAQERSQTTIHGSRALVVGLGRCGTSLATLLKGMGADVAVAARRRSDLARAVALGMTPVCIREMRLQLADMDYVFNTVPDAVLGREELASTASRVVIIDIASSPGGVDFFAAQELNRVAVLAPGIPGKFTPHTAGRILGRVLPRIIIENLPEER